MSKEILSGTEARQKIVKGVNSHVDPIRASVGPHGLNTIIEVSFGRPKSSNDALTISREYEAEDKFENLGVSLGKIVIEETDSAAKGGRSTAALLWQELIIKGFNLIESGSKPAFIRKGMQIALEDVISQLKKSAKQIKTTKEVAQVATISSEDPDSGKLIASILKEIGKDGVVTVESGGTETTYEVIKGMDFNKGFISPMFVTNPDRQIAELENCLVFITDKKLSSIPDILPLLNKMKEAGERKLLIIAEDVDGDALATLIMNRLNGNFNIVAVRAPEWGEYRNQLLSDIAFLCKTEVFSQARGSNIEKIELKSLGRIGKVMVNKEQTVIINKNRDTKVMVNLLKKELANELDKVEQERLRSRIAKLSGGVAVIYVGAYTETDMNYKKQKMTDGVSEAQSALAEGIVTGGGTALAKLKLKYTSKNKDIQAGYDMVKSALSSPLKQIVENTGEMNGEVVLNEILKSDKKYFGYNAETNEFVDDMFEAGIIDSVQSTCSAISNAVDQVRIVLKSGYLNVNKEEPKQINSNGQFVN